MEGPLDGARRWSLKFAGADVALSGAGKLTGGLATLALDGRLAAKTSDAMTPAQLFGITFPGSRPGDGAEIDTGFRWRGGRLVLDDLTGVALGMPMSGALTIDPGKPARIEGTAELPDARRGEGRIAARRRRPRRRAEAGRRLAERTVRRLHPDRLGRLDRSLGGLGAFVAAFARMPRTRGRGWPSTREHVTRGVSERDWPVARSAATSSCRARRSRRP